MEKKLNTRLKIDCRTFAEWEQANPIAQKGEIMIVESPTIIGDSTKNEYLMKIGDGVTNFHNLEYISAKSADVYPWALAPEKPKYTASEIEGLNVDGSVADYTLLENLPSINSFELKGNKSGSDLRLIDPIDDATSKCCKGIYYIRDEYDFKNCLDVENSPGKMLGESDFIYKDYTNNEEYEDNFYDYLIIIINTYNSNQSIKDYIRVTDCSTSALNGKYYDGIYIYMVKRIRGSIVTKRLIPVIHNSAIENMINEYNTEKIIPTITQNTDNITEINNKNIKLENNIINLNNKNTELENLVTQNSNSIAGINNKNTEQDTKISQLEENVNSIFNQIYPINSIIMFNDDKNHSNFLGFTWQRCLENKVPLGYLDGNVVRPIGTTLGEETHRLTTAEVPQLKGRNSLAIVNDYEDDDFAGPNYASNEAPSPHNIMQPSQVIAFWVRIA